MKKFKLIIFATCLMAWCVSIKTLAQQYFCGSDQSLQSQTQMSIDYETQRSLLNTQIYNLEMQRLSNPQQQNSISMVTQNIPVVVHVVHLGEAVGTGTNVSDASIQAMIADLNSRYANTNGFGENMNIQFCLAARDTNNNPTTGITRHNGSSIPGYSANGVISMLFTNTCGSVVDSVIKNSTYWTCKSYYNIWLVNKICGSTQGYNISYPAVTTWDGVVIRANQITNGTLFAHETGHWLGLAHTFEGYSGTTCPPNTNCLAEGDYVCDTPPHLGNECGSTSTCPLPPGGILTNSTANYMSYCFATQDRFTLGQRDRVTTVMGTIPKNYLINSLGCVPLTPNDAGISAIVNPAATTYNTLCGGANYSTAPIVTLKNWGTTTLTSVSIKYKVDNNAPATYSWSGSIAPFTTASVTLPSVSIPQGTHTFQAYTTLPNGVADGYANNDSSSVSSTVTGPTAITTTTSQTNATCAGNDGTATLNAAGGTLVVSVSNLTDWEGANTWTVVNGTQVNKWFVGSATAATGTKSMYVSDDLGVSNHYSPAVSPNKCVSHFYKSFNFPAGASNIKVQFKWKSEGSFGNDYFFVYLTPTTTIPVAGSLIQAGFITYGMGQNSGGYATKIISSDRNLDTVAGSSRNLVFSWRNDFVDQFQPPPSIDDIIVSYTGAVPYAYLWSNGQTTQTATGLAAGTYTCTVTDGNNCTKTTAVVVGSTCTVSISAGGATTFCQGSNVVLTSSIASGNLWSTGATTQSITVTSSGSYSCTNAGNTSNTIVVTVNPIPATPTISNAGATTFCQGGSVTLTSSSATGNLWSTGATTQSINVTTSGNYIVTVTANGCTSSPSIAKVVTVNSIPSTPTISNSGATTFCQGGSVTLTSSSATGNLWSTGATTQSISPTTSGNYVVTVTSNGCTSSPSVAKVVTVNPIPATPTISAGGPTTFCTGGSVTLTSTSATGNLWSNGATTQSISATTSGNYIVTVTSNGCTSSPSSATTVTVQACSISISAGGLTTFCQGGNVVLTSSQPTGNLWSTGATTQSITVSTSGSYNCTYSGNTSNTIVVTVNPIPATPTISADGPTTFCAGGSVTLTSSSATGNTWTPGGVTTQSINVTASGTYTVVVTSNGCTSSPSAGTTVTVQTCGGLTITAGGPTTFCSGGSVTLTSSIATGNVWSNGATTQSIAVTTSGSYSCINSGNTSNTIVVAVNPLPNATISASNGLTFCSGSATILTVPTPGGTTQVWTLNGAYFATASNPLITGGGVYGVTVTNTASGCTATSSVTVTVNPSPPTATTQTGTVSLCSGTLVSGPATGNAASLDGVDDYITIANPVSSDTAFTFEAWIYPKANTSWMRVFDFGNSAGVNMFLAAPSYTGYPRFAINIGSGEQIVESSTALSINTWQHIAVTLSGTTARIYINGLLTGTNAAFTYNPASLGATVNNWIGQSQYPDPTFDGYIDEVRFWNVARAQTALQTNMSKTISPSTIGLVAYYRLDEGYGTSVFELVSGNANVTAMAYATWQVPSTAPWNVAGYAWSNGASTQGINVTTSGTYTLTVTNAAGCTASSAPVIATVKPKPSVTITASGPTTICPGQTVQLSAPARGIALQFDGSNDYAEVANPMIPTSGSYSILFWAKESVAQGGYREIISQGRNFYIGRDNTGIIRVGDGWQNTGVAWPTDLQWHHYAVVRSGSNTYLYLDGNLAATKGSAIGSPIVIAGTPNLFVIGDQFNHGIGENFAGQVDDISIWSNQRTQAQIQAHMSSSPSLATSGLVAYYKLDEGTGASTVDEVSGVNSGILINGPVWVIPSGLPNNIASYLWSNSLTTQSITVGTSATYKVTVANNLGCTATATKKVLAKSPDASIIVTGSRYLCGGSTVTLTSTGTTGFTYQWTKDSTNISGATNKVYIASTAGSYRVIVTNTFGCTKLSPAKVVYECSRLGDVVNESEHNLSLYPNPTAEFITVSFDLEDAVADIQIMNELGAIVLKKQLASDEGTYEEILNVSKLAPGIYMILLQTQNGLSTKRFVKQ